MPIFENICTECENKFEWLARSYSSEDPNCEKCGAITTRLFSICAVIWTKAICAYGDPKSEGYHRQQKAGGHWTLEADKETGKVSKCFIETPKQQSDYCRRNGLINPKDIPPNLVVDKSGMKYETTNRSEI